MYNAGTKTKITTVANIIPKPKLIAIGIKNRACTDVSAIIGAKPKNVVNDVNNMGRNLLFVPAMIESKALIPDCRY